MIGIFLRNLSSRTNLAQTFSNLATNPKESTYVKLIEFTPEYRRFLRICKEVFIGDADTYSKITNGFKHLLRYNTMQLSTDQLMKELQEGANFVKYNVIQAKINPNTGNYKVHIRRDHVEKGDVIKLDEFDSNSLQGLPWRTKNPFGNV